MLEDPPGSSSGVSMNSPLRWAPRLGSQLPFLLPLTNLSSNSHPLHQVVRKAIQKFHLLIHFLSAYGLLSGAVLKVISDFKGIT